MNEHLAIWWANLALCSVIGFIAVSRLDHMSDKTRPSIALAHVALLVAAALGVVGPLVWSWSINFSQLGMELATAMRLVTDSRRISDPSYCRKSN